MAEASSLTSKSISHTPYRLKKLNQPLTKHITDIIKERNTLRATKPADPRITTLSNKITQLIGKHRAEQWKAKLDQIGDHKKNSHTLWNTINYLSGKNPPPQSNTIVKIGRASCRERV